MRVWLGLAVLLAGCIWDVPGPDSGSSSSSSSSGTMNTSSGGPQVEQAETSGSRIKAMRLASEDGAKQFLGWWDSTRQEACTFLDTSDGKRCIPIGNSAVQFRFDDAACTHEVLVPLTGCPAAYGVRFELMSSACQGGGQGARYTQVVQVGPMIASGVTVYTNGAGGCSVIAGNATTYAVGATVPMTAFALATVQTDP